MTPSDTQLLKWKSQFGSIHTIPIEDYTIYYRTLTPNELIAFQELSKALPDREWSEVICELAVLCPSSSNLKFELPGSWTALGDSIISSSLPLDPQTGLFQLDDYRKWLEKVSEESAAYSLAIILARTLPGLNLMDLLNQPMERLLQLLVLAEKITGKDIIGNTATTGNSEDPTEALRSAIEEAKRRRN